MPVLVHNSHAFGAEINGPSFGNKNDLRIKVSDFPGQTFINGISHDVGHAAGGFLRRDQRLRLYLFLGVHIPDIEFQTIPPGGFRHQFGLDQNLGLYRGP